MLKVSNKSSRREVQYVPTDRGIFTETGTWFAATEEEVEAYADGVLRERPLQQLLTDADLWLRSPTALALWALILGLLVLPPVPAALASIVIFAGWTILGPAGVSLVGLRIMRVADSVILQALAYVAILSLLARGGAMASMWVGLAGFIAYRWSLVQRVIEPLVRPLHRSMYELPVPDHVLRSIVVRWALKLRISIPQIEEVERSIRMKWK